jgi:hypothetical protein
MLFACWVSKTKNSIFPLSDRVGQRSNKYIQYPSAPVVFLYPSAHRASHARTGPTLHRASHARTGPTLNETHVTQRPFSSHTRPTSPLDRPSRLFLAGRSAAASLLLFLGFPLFPPSPPPHRHLRNRRQSARIEIVFVLRSSPLSSASSSFGRQAEVARAVVRAAVAPLRDIRIPVPLDRVVVRELLAG